VEWIWPFGETGPEVRFAVAAAVVILAGVKLVQYGDALGGKLKLGQAWVGLVLLAAVTALPELVTSIGAATIHRPQIALGNVFGSILFNTMLIAVIDAAEGKGSLFLRVGRRLAIPIALALVLLGVAACAILAHTLVPNLRLGPVGPETPAILLVYLVGVRVLKRAGAEEADAESPPAGESGGGSTAAVAAKYGLAALAILWAGLNLAGAADAVAEEYEMGRTFVGVTLVAVTTSLPELTCTFAAARRGLVDMAVGNIFGSNAFNIVIIAVADFFYPGSIVRGVVEAGSTRTQMIAVLFAALTGAIVLVSLRLRVRRTVGRVAWPSLAIFVGYLAAAFLIYRVGG